MTTISPKRQTGDRWEQVAFDYLKRRGLVEVKRNHWCRQGEVDLIMMDGEQLCFVEVRYRARSDFGGAAASVDGIKCRKIAMAAQHFLAQRPDFQGWPCRFDVVTVSGRFMPRVEWLSDAFRLDDI